MNDKGSTTEANMFKLQQATGLSPMEMYPTMVMEALDKEEQIMPVTVKWRIPLLEKLLVARNQIKHDLEDTTDYEWLINRVS